ncbi:MAG TPA: laminin G domain-containing protein [Streptosporangiaceae bacterium]
MSYTYQVGAAAPVTVTTSAGAGYVWSGPITVTRIGPIDPTVYATSAAGNLSADNQAALSGTPPSQAYPEGYFTGGQYPDLIMVGTGANQSLWLKEGTGNGTLGTPTDIGSMGTGINAGTAPDGGNNDGPTDWSDAEVLQGNFTGHNVQDVMAYYTTGPHQGAAVILDGDGDSSPLVPTSGTSYTVLPGQFQCLNQEEPTDLAPAGNITGLGSDNDDLIGVCGTELDVYSDGSTPGYYSTICQGTTCQPLSAQSPDNDPWGDFTLATAEPGNDPSTVVIFALDNTTGQLWESTDSAGTWSAIQVPWGSNPPTLLQGDINSQGAVELWTQSGSADPSYTLSGSALAEEYAQPTSAALGEWPLTDGNLAAQGGADSTAVNTITASTASLNGSAGWGDPSYFGTDVSFDGQSGYLLPPAATIPDSNTQPKISLWFNTTTAGGVLLSLQSNPVTSGSTISGGYDPVLYIGTDGKLYAEWWNGSPSPAVSATPVDDGLWHHVVLTAYAGSQNLYVDNQAAVNLTGATELNQINTTSPNYTNLTVGTGYLGGSWPTEPHYSKTNNTGYLDYFQGQIADVVYSYPGGP